MLKIAEYNKITGKKIELSELEKFGFEIIIKNKQLLYVWKNKYLINVIEINAKTREIINLGDRCGTVVLYDLIEAGYVEKVEE